MTAAESNTGKPRSVLASFSIFMLTLMCVLPFLSPYHMPPIASFYNEWLAALLAVFASLFLIGYRQEKLQIPLVTFVPLALIVVLGLQVTLGGPDYWQNQFVAMLYLGLAALLIVLAANLKHSLSLESIVPAIAWAFVIGATTIMILLPIGKILPEESVFAKWILAGKSGNIGQVNHFSNYLALGLASLLYLRLTGRINTVMTLLISALILIGFAQGGQRMAILYVVLLSIGGWLLARTFSQNQTTAIKPIMLLWLIPAFIAAQFIVPLLGFLEPAKMPAERLVQTMGTESSRLILVEQAWLLFKQHPWLGAGWAEFSWYNFSITESYPSLKGLWHHAHNLILQLLAETGIVGALILTAGILYWFREQFLSQMNAERWWLLALLSVIGIHSMLEYPLWYMTFLAITSLLLGLGSERPLQVRFNLAPAFFLVIFIFAAWSLGSLQTSYHQLETTLTSLREQGLPQSEIDKNLEKLYQLRETSVFTPIADNFLVRVLPNQPGLIKDKLTISQQVIENWPGQVETYTHAYLLAMNNKPVEAQQMIRMAIKQFPEYRETYHRYVLAQVVKKQQNALLPILIILQDPHKPAK
ncbi:PglL family O-oligosaccharyltransferase [Methylophaga thiooxydans]|uniref:O-Antigen Polymerase family n=1 Tax=Methylophaga thiooxydans DMS010 TaxID=637616 RepID=C0N7U4_9GAMM|nr:O-antigen ligase family protein [Methylophaga thiooxydans]EEF79411.1 O-Antigen Polymerase family [Methylophaga thiooxydans DMS010]